MQTFQNQRRVKGISSTLTKRICSCFRSLNGFYPFRKSEYIINEVIRLSGASLDDIQQTIIDSEKYDIFVSTNEDSIVERMVFWIKNKEVIINKKGN